MNNYILFIFEGEKTERYIFSSLVKYFLNEAETTKVCSYYCTDIYNLYLKVEEDPDLDLFSLLKEKNVNTNTLSSIPRENVSEIYLFFDYDGHAPTADDEKIKKLLNFFDQETDNGKLYISYPMVESIKHLKNDVPFDSVVVNCKTNIKYKNLVHINSDPIYRDLENLSRESWSNIISEHCMKIHHLMTGDFSLPTLHTPQIDVFNKQEEKHIVPNGEVAVLSAFPILIADYYGCENLSSLILEKQKT